jgi:hypothetical protein
MNRDQCKLSAPTRAFWGEWGTKDNDGLIPQEESGCEYQPVNVPRQTDEKTRNIFRRIGFIFPPLWSVQN